MAIFEITHLSDQKYKRNERIYFGVGDCILTDDCEKNYSENICEKNFSYCELTAFYCIYKNIDCDFVAIEHYRRAFLNKKSGFLTNEQCKKILRKKKIILPAKYSDKNRTMFEFYAQNHEINDYYVIREVIRKYYPEYMDSFNAYFSGHESYLFNMLVCDKKLFNDYCEWLFDILQKSEEFIDDSIEQRSSYQKRVYGFLAERLLNIWVLKNFSKRDVYQLPVLFISDKKNKMSFFKKILRYAKYTIIN